MPEGIYGKVESRSHKSRCSGTTDALFRGELSPPPLDGELLSRHMVICVEIENCVAVDVFLAVEPDLRIVRTEASFNLFQRVDSQKGKMKECLDSCGGLSRKRNRWSRRTPKSFESESAACWRLK
jgi:hypothetical protein